MTTSLRRSGAVLLAAIAITAQGCSDPSAGGSTSGVDGDVAGEAIADRDGPRASWFTDITESSGLAFVHETGATGSFLLPEIMGSGAALLDYDLDGDLDIYLVNGNGTLPEGGVAETPVNRLYRRGDDGRYEDVTDASGLGDGGYGMGVAVGDIDDDGDPDLYVTNYGADRLYRNRGDGTFEDVTESAGIDVGGWSTSAAFTDFDRDGDLDLFVARYLEFDARQGCTDVAGRPDYCGPRSFPPTADVLLRNDGAAGFTDVTAAAGIDAAAAGAGLGVVCADVDDDGWIDVYVANDGDPNHLWINQGDGTFAERALVMGAALNLHGQTEAGMGVIAADFDRDERVDLFVSHQALETNTLYGNRGGRSGFVDRSGERGLAASSLAETGFGAAAFDAELDGDLDLVVVGGRVLRADPRSDSSIGPPWDRYAEPNLFYVGEGDRFELATETAISRTVDVSRGLAVGDIDDDGDIDLLVSNGQGPARLYRNDAPRAGHWLSTRVLERGRDAIGAKVTVRAANGPFVAFVGPASSYLSSNDPRLLFGLGDAADVERVEVRWPDGETEHFTIDAVDRAVELRRGEGVTP